MLLFTLLSPALAATLAVDPSGAADYSTITDAINAASSGDTLTLAAGTYAECVNTGGRSLTLDAEPGAVLDSSTCGFGLTVYYGETVTVRGLTLTGSRGVYAAYSTLNLVEVIATGLGDEGAYGGALESYTSTVNLTDCLFEDNLGAYGGAVFLAWYNAYTDQGSVYEGNTAVYGGGAMYTNAYDVLTLEGVTATGNSSPSGGAMVIAWASGLTVSDSVFEANTTSGAGGAMYLYAVDPTASITDSTFTANAATGTGGALELEWYTDLSVTGSTFTQNQSGSWGGALFTYVLDAITVRDSLFCANSAAYGGALGIQWTTVDGLYNSLLVENQAIQGGALYRYASGAGTLQNNTLAGNTTTDWGGAYLAGWYAYAALSNNLIVGSAVGTGAYASDPYDYSNSTLKYNGWYDNAPQAAGGYFYVEDGVDGSVLADPLFVAWTANGDCSDDDLRLATGSPMRDAGDPSLVDPDGSRSDIGAWGGPGAPVEDRDGDGADTTADCDDSNGEIGPGAAEVCDGLDNDCDGEADGALAEGASPWYTDWDGDGYGDDATVATACDAPEGAVAQGGDCDDINPYQSPGAADVCGDGFDQDCTGADAVCDTGAPQDTGDVEQKEGGCGCSTSGSGVSLWPAALALLALRRRR